MKNLRMAIAWWLVGLAIDISPKGDPEAVKLALAVRSAALTPSP